MGTGITILIINTCWLVFIGYWVLTWASTKRTIERPKIGDLLANRIPVGIGAWLLFGTIWATRRRVIFPWNPILIPESQIANTIGVCLCVLGVAGCLWARRTIGRNWSGDVVFKEKHELVENGPYRFVRHPIYTSLLAMALGSAICAGGILAFVGFVLMAVGFIIKLKQEEKLMLSHFPAEYADYKKRVKTLVPFVW